MHKRLRIIVGFLIIFELTASGRAQQQGQLPIPVLQNVQVQSRLSFDAGTRLYTYSYTISNPATNTGEIWSIGIDISQPPDSLTLSSEGLTLLRGNKTKTFDELIAKFKGTNIPIVPIGARVPHGGWTGSVLKRGEAGFFSSDAPNIFPGQTRGGFELISRGLPAIRDVEIRPWWIYVSEGSATKEGTKQAKEIEKNITFRTKTLGPTAPPADFKPAAFLDYIIGLKHQAVSLGWIKNEGVVNSLDVKLDNAKKKIADGSPGAAKNILNAFINEVEAQGCASYENCPPGKHLTSEAYALLKYNVQYLIDNLSK